MATAKIINYRGAVDNFEIAWITMPDGRKLAARLLLPKKVSEKIPCIFEYIPYRRRDGTRLRDDETHYWFAAHGYGAARTETEVAMTPDKTHFHMEGHVRTLIDGKPFIARDFKRSFRRDCL